MVHHGANGGGPTRRNFLRMATGVSAGVVGGSILGLAGCGPQAPSRTSTSATVTVCFGTDLRSVDPHADTSRNATNIWHNYYSTLVKRDAELKLVPMLATAWKRTSPTVWEFKLRQNVKFHNGQPFSAADVKFTFDRILNRSLGLQLTSRLAGTIQGVEVLDPTTVRFVTKQPDPLIPDRVVQSAILPSEAFRGSGAGKIATTPIGSGPYKFVEWVKDDRLTLEANRDYWGERPKIAKLIHKPILEAATRVAALKTGALDLVVNVQPQQVAEIEADPKLRVVRVPNARVYFVGLNTFRKPFDDVRVRQAMNYAVDVDSIIKDLWGGHAYRTPSILSRDWFGYDPEQKPYAYDPAKARALLTEAGYPKGFEVPFSTAAGRYQLDVETAQAVSGYLAKIGVSAKVELVEYGNYLARLFDAKNPDNRFTMFYIGYSTGLLDADDLLGAYLDSKRRGLYYNHPKLDELIAKGLVADTPEQRKAVYREILAHVKEAAPWVFLFNGEDIYGANRRLVGWQATADEAVDLSKISVG